MFDDNVKVLDFDDDIKLYCQTFSFSDCDYLQQCSSNRNSQKSEYPT